MFAASTAMSAAPLHDPLDLVGLQNGGHCAVERDLRHFAPGGGDVVHRRLEPVERRQLRTFELVRLRFALGRRELVGPRHGRVDVTDPDLSPPVAYALSVLP